MSNSPEIAQAVSGFAHKDPLSLRFSGFFLFSLLESIALGID
jgi:hypothetical protein